MSNADPLWWQGHGSRSRSIITAEKFEAKVGHKPEQDDLERSNCDRVGSVGHSMCGWCDEHEKPRFMCGCLKD